MTYNVEYTDTFGGEANYAWLRRATVKIGTLTSTAKRYQSAVMRAAKAAVGISGMRGRTFSHGDFFEFRPYGCCTVLFVTPSLVDIDG